mgnify:CR=1 FL=1
MHLAGSHEEYDFIRYGGPDAAPVTTDGPHPETSDLIAGWWMIDVDSHERAVELVAQGERRVVEMCRRRGLEQSALHRARTAIVADATVGIPLVRFVTDREKMGRFVIAPWLASLAWAIAAIIVVLNVKLLYDTFVGG